MTSILMNQSAMSALSSLSATQRSLQTAQGQVSSGLRVSGASDNAAYWSISTAMKSQVAALSAVNDGLALTKSIADVTASALQGVIGIVQSIEKDVVSAQQPGVDVNAVQQSIIGLQNQIKSIVESASFNGVNWLVDDKPYQITENFVSNYTNSSSKADYDNLNSLDVAPYAETDNYDQNLQENIQVTSPSGTVSTFSENSDTSYIFSKASGSSVSNAANVAYSDTPVSNIAAYTPPVDHIPESYSGSGLELSDRDDFTILDPSTVTTSTWNYSETDAGSNPITFQYKGKQLFFSTPSVTAFITQAVQSSSLSSILGLDITAPQSAPGANADTVESTLSSLTSIATKVGALQTRVSTQQAFNSALSDAITAGVGSLVDADMNIASTRLQALQTQQQLGIQSLSIANQNSQLIKKLFG